MKIWLKNSSDEETMLITSFKSKKDGYEELSFSHTEYPKRQVLRPGESGNYNLDSKFSIIIEQL